MPFLVLFSETIDYSFELFACLFLPFSTVISLKNLSNTKERVIIYLNETIKTTFHIDHL